MERIATAVFIVSALLVSSCADDDMKFNTKTLIGEWRETKALERVGFSPDDFITRTSADTRIVFTDDGRVSFYQPSILREGFYHVDVNGQLSLSWILTNDSPVISSTFASRESGSQQITHLSSGKLVLEVGGYCRDSEGRLIIDSEGNWIIAADAFTWELSQ